MENFKNLAVFGKDQDKTTQDTLSLLDNLSIRYKYIPFRDEKHEMSLRSKIDAKGCPIIMINNEYIGDIDELKKYIQKYYKYFE